MSLVAYQSSSEESEDESQTENPDYLDGESASLKAAAKEPTKRKEPVKITVPAITEDDDEEESSPNKKLKMNSSSGLLSMLPPPKFSAAKGKTNTLVPYVLTKKKEEPHNEKDSKKVLIAASTRDSQLSNEINSTSSLTRNVASAQKKTGVSSLSDFFSLQNSDEDEPLSSQKYIGRMNLPAPVVSTTSNFAGISDVSNNFSSTDPAYDFNHAAYSQTSVNQDNHQLPSEAVFQNEEVSSMEQEDIIKDERFLRLQGKRRDLEEINIVDVNLDTALPSKTEWHTKSLTEEKVSHSRKRNHMPTQQQKRKHQITYLAFQAKEREVDLKNQWSQNRLTRRETQAKYGF